MLLALSNSPVPTQPVQKRLVSTLVERRKLEPILEMDKHLFIRSASDEVLQQRDMAAAKTTALCEEPGVENRTAVYLQPFEKIPGEQSGQRLQSRRRERLDALLGCAGDLDRIDEAIRKSKLDGIGAGVDPG